MKPVEDPRCVLVERWIHLSLDGELSPELDEKLESHLDECLDCRQRHRAAFEHHSLLDDELQQLTGNMDALLTGRLELGIEDREPGSEPVSNGWTPSRFVGWVTAAAASIVVLVTLWSWDPPRSEDSLGVPVGKLTWTGGGVTVGDRSHPGSSSGPLTSGSVVGAPDNTQLSIILTNRQFGEGQVQGLRGGRFTTEVKGGALGFEIAWGTFDFDLDHAAGFVVRSPLGEVRVVGTRFTVGHTNSPEPETRITVQSGKVRVRHRRAGRHSSDFRGLVLVAGDILILTEKTMTMPPVAARPAAHENTAATGETEGLESPAPTARRGEGPTPARQPDTQLDMPVKKD